MLSDDLKLIHNDNSSICIPKQEPTDTNDPNIDINKHQPFFTLNTNQFHSPFNVNTLSQITNASSANNNNNNNQMRISDNYDYLRIKMSPDHNAHQLDNSLNALRNNINFSMDSNHLDLMNGHDGQGGSVVRTRRRKAGINDEDRVCVVCGEPASGYNFDRLTCESCKAFFRRNALKPRDKIKKCNRHGQCNIEGSQRKHCPSCRLEKCLAAGMKKELILPPEKLEQRAKPRRRKNQSVNDDGSVSSPGGMGGSTSGTGTIIHENGSNHGGYIGNGRFSPLQVNSPYGSASNNVSHLMMSQTNNLTLAVAAVAAMNQQRITNSSSAKNPVMNENEKNLLNIRNHYPISSSSPSLFGQSNNNNNIGNNQRNNYSNLGINNGIMAPLSGHFLHNHRNNSGSESPSNTTSSSANEMSSANILSNYPCNQSSQQSISSIDIGSELSKGHSFSANQSLGNNHPIAANGSNDFFLNHPQLMNQSRSNYNHHSGQIKPKLNNTDGSNLFHGINHSNDSSSSSKNNNLNINHPQNSRYVPFRPGFAPILPNGSNDQDTSKEFYPLDSRSINGLPKKYLCLKNFLKTDPEDGENDGSATLCQEKMSLQKSLNDNQDHEMKDESAKIMCRHSPCRRWNIRRARLSKINSNTTIDPTGDAFDVKKDSILPPDSRLLNALNECVQRIREPFTPSEHLETKVAETLEQEYNRMDACIRRIIKVVKILPFFNDIGRPAQLGLLRANIYGLIVLYSSFFFERNIKKLRYPVLQLDGNLTFATVSMLDDVTHVKNSTSSSPNCDQSNCDGAGVKGKPNAPPLQKINSNSGLKTSSLAALRTDFELYKANTLSAFDILDRLTGSDDTLRVALLAVKLFSVDNISGEHRQAVNKARKSYILFLWSYLRWNHNGPLHLVSQRFAWLLLTFVDIRTLEARMTDFAKLLSLDSLSPLMREVCSQKMMSSPANSSTTPTSTMPHHHHSHHLHHHGNNIATSRLATGQTGNDIDQASFNQSNNNLTKQSSQNSLIDVKQSDSLMH